MRSRTSAISCVLLLLAAGAARADDHSDQWQSATRLQVGARVAGVLDVAGDRDWFRLDVRGGTRLRLRTLDLGPGADTYIDAYGVDGRWIGGDDDSAGNLASQLAYAPPRDGPCWIVVRHYSSNGRGSYALIVEDLSAPAPAPTPAPTPAPAPAPTTPVAGTGTIAAAPVFDPKLEGASLQVTTRVGGATNYTATLRVLDASGRVVATPVSNASRAAGQGYADAWDGREAGRFVAPGAYTLRLLIQRPGATDSTLDRAVRVARLGLVSVRFEDTADRVQLAYHAMGGGNRFAVDSAGPAWALPRSTLGDKTLDKTDGAPLDLPAPWADVNAPPRDPSGSVALRGRSLPVAYTLGARPRARLALGDRAVAGGAAVTCGYPITGAPVRIVHATSGVATNEVAPGGEVTLDLPAVSPTVGRTDLALELRFEAWDGAAWVAVPGRHRTLHRVYTVVARPQAWATPRAWVAVLDLVTGWAAGRGDAAGVLASVTEGLNARSGLRYDVVGGAPAYTGGWRLATPTLDLESFLSRRMGNVVNCLDCAALVTTLSAHAGAESQVTIMGDNFMLHWIKGIGGSQFIHDLFGGYHGFSFHAVGTIDGGATIHDPCLRVDEDPNPASAPFTERLPVGMPWPVYRDKLSPGVPRLNDLGHAQPN